MSLLDNLPPVLSKIVKAEDVAQIGEDDEKKFLLVCSRELKQAELDVLTSYGKVLIYRDSYQNIPLDKLLNDSVYCVLNIHQKSHRVLLGKEDLSAYHVVAVINNYDTCDDWMEDVGAENVVKGLPDHQAFKADFNRLLITKKIRKASCVKSVYRILLKVLRGWADE
jgi:hypothetical protein